ncbi:MAG: hypothetical protein H6666_15140 [Ardenticatenaceae bacterium]|nr:hypothetical protein [Ardenticatenaceae bacterium]
MEKVKNVFTILGVGITIGIVITVIFLFVIRATPTRVTVGGVEFEIPTSTIVPTQEPIVIIPSATDTPQNQAANTQSVVLQPAIPPVPTQSPILIHSESASPESLARIVGGDAAYWKQAGPVVWVYSNKNNNTTMRHPGENMVLTYWAGFGDPQNASDCQIIISPVDSLEKAVKCPSGTNAQIIADQVGLHVVDYTGFFP